ncbi:hypothetical protein F2Q69_00061872 [Brassica cretica]|uniref:Uncharacterized protein n=1 Tax=Brassica cretica TaxID=69181 RepID=A0A8S9RG65_BRACR|nr:hypothetical protein F2Q69_00061872 [Brassica cretica]
MTESAPPFTPSPPVPASRSSQLTESLKLEHQLLRLEEGSSAENLQMPCSLARIDHLDSADAENITELNNTKLKQDSCGLHAADVVFRDCFKPFRKLQYFGLSLYVSIAMEYVSAASLFIANNELSSFRDC